MTSFDENKPYVVYLFEQYVANNGAEKAAGYIDALKEVVLQLGEVLYDSNSRSNSPNIVRTKLNKFYDEKFVLLNSHESFNLVEPTGSSNIKGLDAKIS